MEIGIYEGLGLYFKDIVEEDIDKTFETLKDLASTIFNHETMSVYYNFSQGFDNVLMIYNYGPSFEEMLKTIENILGNKTVMKNIEIKRIA